MTEQRYLFDSSCLLKYLTEDNEVVKNFLFERDCTRFISRIAIYETAKELLKKYNEKEVQEKLRAIEKTARVVETTTPLLIQAAKTSLRYHLSAMDSIIYTSAQQENAMLLTHDKDFKGMKKVKLLA